MSATPYGNASHLTVNHAAGAFVLYLTIFDLVLSQRHHPYSCGLLFVADLWNHQVNHAGGNTGRGRGNTSMISNRRSGGI